MNDWINKLFVEHADLFLKLLNQRWAQTEELVNGMSRLLDGFGIKSGSLLDLCCGNGRVSICMAKRGFKTVGVDISRAFIEDARKKAGEHGVSSVVTFLEGDVRKLKKVVGGVSQPFDVVVNAWTSIGFYSVEDDLEFMDKVDIEHHVYSPSELSFLLGKAGWETLAFYGRLSTLQPMSPLTSLNIVAKAS